LKYDFFGISRVCRVCLLPINRLLCLKKKKREGEARDHKYFLFSLVFL
jgi:hypothetical protein